MTDTLIASIRLSMSQLLIECDLDGCACYDGDWQNPPETCEACWAMNEFRHIIKWYTDASHDLDACDLDSCMAVVESHFIPEWFSTYSSDMAAHQLDELQRTVLFCYDILPILSDYIK